MISGIVTDIRLVCERWRDSPLTRSSIDRFVRVADLVGGDDPRADRAERVDALGQAEHARLHLLALDVARGDVVEDDVAGDVVLGLLGREELAGLADDDGELELVVELVGHRLGVDDRVVGADDRVDVLEEHDPRQHRVRPVDALGLLVVLAEVAGGVEELLGDDRRPQRHLVQRRLVGRSAPPPRRARSSGACRARRARSPGRRPPARRARRRRSPASCQLLLADSEAAGDAAAAPEYRQNSKLYASLMLGYSTRVAGRLGDAPTGLRDVPERGSAYHRRQARRHPFAGLGHDRQRRDHLAAARR